MTRVLDGGTLDRVCDASPGELSGPRAARAVEALGWLAPWWLTPEPLACAAAHRPAYRRYDRRPDRPRDPGACWVVFVRPRELRLLRPAFLLPLHWRFDAGADPCLPGPLRELSERVRGQFPEAGAGRCLWLASE